MKKKWLAILLSFILPGLGQLYLGLFARGFIILGLSVGFYFLSTELIPALSIVCLILWVVGMIDSAKQTKKINLKKQNV
ncbi:hypothetical protein BAMA_10445 [Bacillus manliponensis]|uniref:Sugar ABC transporter permease n=1 Tax=Bacillus manliponensis TaxID=574376 RepID=A0A073JUP6_9BACI|nr:hypothetical protein [Bacillus manliponensis]KEK17896.1 hypothetical protein BAMA_10445 [Bacillus manliponensis]